MPMQYEDVADLLPKIVDNPEIATADQKKFIESDLRCQAELVQYRKLLKGLHNLRTDVLEPAPGLLSDVLANLERSGEQRAVKAMLNGKKAAYAGGLAAATAAGVVGVVIFANRARRAKLAS